MLNKILLLILITFTKNTNNYKLDGIYNIINIYSNLNLNIFNNKIELKRNYKSYFRIINIKNESYFIESFYHNSKLGINYYDNIYLEKNIEQNDLKFQWNIIRNVKRKSTIIQNKYNKKILEVNNNELKFSDDNNKTLIINNRNLFLFNKLFEEYKYKREFFKKTLKEPIDIIIKYIDLNDRTLNRTGINQTYKDKDNKELKYCLKSILQYLPWIRKIYILMPNKLVTFLKSIDEINDKIIYINDKNLLGFDSANIQSFLFNLFKIESFGVSKNFIYMEDDYFIGKKLFKTDFFYFDEKEKKIVPFIISYKFNMLNKSFLFDKYFSLKNKKVINAHSNDGFRCQIYNTEKFILEQYNRSLIKIHFTHNSIPENIDDLKIIFNKSNKYEYKNATLYSKYRSIQSLCHQHFLNIFNLNIKHRKVHLIKSTYIQIEKLRKIKLDKNLFVINTGGNHIPLNREYKIQIKIMNKRFKFDIIYDKKDRKKSYIELFISIYKSVLKVFIIFIIFKLSYSFF